MAETFTTGLKNVAVQYARLLKLKITASSIKKTIEQNPYYPSLLSLSDTFTKFNVPNNGFKVDKETLEQLELPVAAYYHHPQIGKDFILVTGITDNTVSYLHQGSKQQTISKQVFLTRYQEVVWMAEPGKESGEPDFEARLQVEKKSRFRSMLLWVMGLILIVLVAAINITGANAIVFMPVFFIKLMGLAATVLLLAYELDKSNAFIKNICTGGAKTNCEAVLDSKAAKLGAISWSEVGFFYFAATTVFLLLPGVPVANKTAWLAIGNAMAAPYMVFSIYYQWRVVKNWCPFCLATQAVLLMELIWSILSFWGHPSLPILETGTFFALSFCVGLPITLWYTVKPVLKKANEAERFEAAYKRLHHHPLIFNSLLQQQQKAPDGWQQIGITIGNPDAINHIIKVCNPYCGPCAKAHRVLEELLHRKDIKLTIIFNTPVEDVTCITGMHLLAIARAGDEINTRKALHEWYLSGTKDYRVFAEKYPVKSELLEERIRIEKMQLWCKEAQTMVTPTIFLNGFWLPENYSIEDLKDFL
jgi:uncharacterized membrane protein